MRALPARQPHAGPRLGPSAGRRHAAEVRARRERGRGGRGVLRPRRHRADEGAASACRSTRSPSTARCASSARSSDPSLADPGCIARVLEEIAIVQPQDDRRDGRGRAATRSTTSRCRSRGRSSPTLGRGPALTPSIDALVRAEHRRVARRGGGQARVLVGLPGARRSGTRTCRPTSLVGAVRLLPARRRAAGGRAGAPALVAASSAPSRSALCALVAAARCATSRSASRSSASGAALLAAALTRADAGAGATPVEALFAAAAGMLFAVGFASRPPSSRCPLLVAGIDAAPCSAAARRPFATSTSAPDDPHARPARRGATGPRSRA